MCAASCSAGPPGPVSARCGDGYLQAVLRQQMLDAARAVGATPLRNIALDCVLHLLIALRWRPGWAAAPLVVATARDLQELTQATDLQLGLLLLNPRVLYGSGGAKDAAAFLKISRSSFKRAFSFRRRCSSS
jgi:hypothetical protein